jgi:hypothetical protein
MSALRASELDEALKWYVDAFCQDLNRPYAGLAALGLLCVRNELAHGMPATWAERFDSDDDAARALVGGDAQFGQLASTLQFSLKSHREALQRQPVPDTEAMARMELLEADFAFLTSPRPKAVAQRYRDALDDQPISLLGTVHEQLAVFWQLGVRNDFAASSLAAVTELMGGQPALTGSGEPPRASCCSRATWPTSLPARRPASSQNPRRPGGAVAAPGNRRGAGACSGRPSVPLAEHGGTRCHEVRRARNSYANASALPRERYCVTSVQHGGARLGRAFTGSASLVAHHDGSEELPEWPRGKTGHDLWRASVWMFFSAMALHCKSDAHRPWDTVR